MREPKCWICMDEGFVMFDKNGYATISRCSCKAGNKWAYDGQACTERKTRYYVQNISELFNAADIALANRSKWLEQTKQNQGGHEDDNNADQATG